MSYLLVAFSVNFSSSSSLAVGAICRAPTVVVKVLNYMLWSPTPAQQKRTRGDKTPANPDALTVGSFSSRDTLAQP